MSDKITAKGNDSKFKPHPQGQFIGQCVDTIDLGERVESFAGQPKKLAHKCALIFRTGEKNAETGEYIDIGKEFTVSMGDKANLRKFLEQWRGKKYDAETVKKGVPLDKLTGNWALLSVGHRDSANGRTYADITAAVGVPEKMRGDLPAFDGYKRADFWQQRKEEYRKEAQAFRAEAGAPPNDDDDFGPIDEEDDLPF